MRRNKSNTLYCFSPPVMLATFAIEIGFAAYVVWRYHMNVIARLVVSILTLLALFQATEYMLCGGYGIEGGTWSRIGYSAITLLPPLGIHLAYAIAGRKANSLVAASYISGAAFVAYFAFATGAVSGHTCYANYATFNVTEANAMMYTAYYYGWLFIGTFLAFKWAPSLEKGPRRALYALMAGYLALLIPTTTVNLIDQSTIGGIPSIMCGFAVILAFLITLRVAPETLQVRARQSFRLPIGPKS